MTADRIALANRFTPYFEVQLLLARRMAALTGDPVGGMAREYTNLSHRLGQGAPLAEPPTAAWLAYEQALDAVPYLADQIALTRQTFIEQPQEAIPAPGQTLFGCFAHEAPDRDGRVKIHFYNRDTDDAGGPLAAGKAGRRRGDLAAMVVNIREVHPDATAIQGGSWLYNLEAYRRLFPADYIASRVAPDTVRLTGTSTWGQLLDSRSEIRPAVRDALVANLEGLDPRAPWRAFPLRALRTSAPLTSFEAFYGL